MRYDVRPLMPLVNLQPVRCPSCTQKMPALRMPQTLMQLLCGGWTCPHCSTQFDKWGTKIEPRNQRSAS